MVDLAKKAPAAVERQFDIGLMQTMVRPSWWSSPAQCHNGDEWGPGMVTVGGSPCECPEARATGMGHLCVRCRAVSGCPAIWYRPSHSPPAHRPPPQFLPPGHPSSTTPHPPP